MRDTSCHGASGALPLCILTKETINPTFKFESKHVNLEKSLLFFFSHLFGVSYMLGRQKLCLKYHRQCFYQIICHSTSGIIRSLGWNSYLFTIHCLTANQQLCVFCYKNEEHSDTNFYSS